MRSSTLLAAAAFLAACAPRGGPPASPDPQAAPAAAARRAPFAGLVAVGFGTAVRVSACDSGDPMPVADSAGPVTPIPYAREHSALPIPNACDTPAASVRIRGKNRQLP